MDLEAAGEAQEAIGPGERDSGGKGFAAREAAAATPSPR
jgi:hypothetical protein